MAGAFVHGWWIFKFCFSRLEKGDELILIGKLDLRVVTVSCRNNK